nr:hypothetical protein [Clostridia bacterium]
MNYVWKKEPNAWTLRSQEREILSIPLQAGCEDAFECLEEGAWRWTRTCAQPMDQMCMTVESADAVRYWQVPGVNYNGNGWGSGAQYYGYGDRGEPWTYAWHRVAIPACTYVESENWAMSLFGEETGGMSGSIWAEEGKARQALLWPEQEGPKVLFKRCWMDRYQGSMEPQSAFSALLLVTPAKGLREGYRDLMDFAWRHFDRALTMEKTPEQIIKLDTLWFRALWHKQFDGLTGFRSGMHWDDSAAMFLKNNIFEIGWVGQNASVACCLLREFLRTGDQDLRDKALGALDSWVKYAVLDNGLMLVRLVADPNHLDSVANGDIPIDLDACNLGTAATYFFKAAKLAEQCGTPRPEYEKTALGLCDFALRAQQENGEFAKSWFMDGSANAKHGTVGVFFTLPLFDAHRLTGERKYLDAALRSLDFYYGQFAESGYTTAGALDSNCIDKESAAPLLRAALCGYRATRNDQYLQAAETVAYYLATWQWHYTVPFPKGSMAADVGFDTY